MLLYEEITKEELAKQHRKEHKKQKRRKKKEKKAEEKENENNCEVSVSIYDERASNYSIKKVRPLYLKIKICFL